ncbi:MAG: hypothetical protein HY690_03915 [Chloroflexi bacterium]|nr:hypothetical protein [Chloroflexota bacterium]
MGFSLFGKPKIEGYIGAYGLADWWLSAFSAAERERIESTFHPMGETERRPLTMGQVGRSSRHAAGFLTDLATWLMNVENCGLALRVLAKAEALAATSSDVLDLHFVYGSQVPAYYRLRKTDPAMLDAAIVACEKQIALGPRAARAFRRWYRSMGTDDGLPEHTGFEQLAIIRERQGDYVEAIRLCKEAKRQGWGGNWDERIARCGKRARQQIG